MRKLSLIIGAMAIVSGAAVASTYDANLRYTQGEEFNKGRTHIELGANTGVVVGTTTITPSLGYEIKTDSDSPNKDAKGKKAGSFVSSVSKDGSKVEFKNSYSAYSAGVKVDAKPSDALHIDFTVKYGGGGTGNGAADIYFNAADNKTYFAKDAATYQTVTNVNFMQDVNKVWFGLVYQSVDMDGAKDGKDTNSHSIDYSKSSFATDVIDDAFDGYNRDDGRGDGIQTVVGLGYTFDNKQVSVGIKAVKFMMPAADKKAYSVDPKTGKTTFFASQNALAANSHDEKGKPSANGVTALELKTSYAVSDSVSPYASFGMAMVDKKTGAKQAKDEKGKVVDAVDGAGTGNKMLLGLGVKGTF